MPALGGLRSAAESLTAPVLRRVAVERWPRWAVRVNGVQAPRGIVPHDRPSPRGGAHIGIVLQLLDDVRSVPGDVAECGVYRGGTLVPMGLHLRRQGGGKHLYGFDSFQGFDDAVEVDIALGGSASADKRVGGFADASFTQVERRVRRFGVGDAVTLVPGYFSDTLERRAGLTFSFVHLDCDIYESYKECLKFFYPRMNRGGVILFDEYNDPPWPGCNLAVDEFLADRPERPVEIERDNFQKWFITKQ
jgi:hypothetical protein